jgi:hypothetical protein
VSLYAAEDIVDAKLLAAFVIQHVISPVGNIPKPNVLTVPPPIHFVTNQPNFWVFVSDVLNQHSIVIVERNCVEYDHAGTPRFTASFTPSNKRTFAAILL